MDDCALSDGVKAEIASSAILWFSLALGLAVLPTGCATPATQLLDVGMARSRTTTTLRKHVFAFAFDQEGLMAGLGLQGSKITEITPNP